MNDQNLTGSAIEQITGLARESAVPQINEAVHFAIAPSDSRVIDLSAYQFPDGRRPSRIIAAPKMSDAGSFTDYYKRYFDAEKSLVFADPARFSFLGILDWHPAGERTPEFASHRVSYQMLHDERWKIWIAKNDKPFTQEEFAEFIEDNRRDVTVPDGGTMMEIASRLEATVNVNFASATNLGNGQRQLRYEETVKAGIPTAGNMEVPESFTIRIPVFFGEEPVSIEARLRFRISQGKLTFQYKLYRPVETMNDAFTVSMKRIATDIQHSVILGSVA